MSTPWPYIMAKKQAEEAAYRAQQAEQELSELRDKVRCLERENRRLMLENAKLKEEIETLRRK